MRFRLALLVALGLSALGLVDAWLVCDQLGLIDGLRTCAQDPGKLFFHIALLPIAAYCFVVGFPAPLVERLWQSRVHRSVIAAIYVVCLGAAGTYAIGDAHDGFEDRAPWPPDVSERFLTKDGVTAPVHLSARRSSLRVEVREGVKSPQQALDRYEAAVDEILGKPRDYSRQGSGRAHWAGLLTVLGALFAAAVLATILVLVYARSFDAYAVNALTVTVILSSLWIGLRAYSEWYGNLELLEWPRYIPFLVVGLTVAVAAFFLWTLREWAHPKLVVSVALSTLVAVAAGIGQFKPQWIRAFAQMLADVKWPGMVALYAIAALLIAGTAWSLMREPA